VIVTGWRDSNQRWYWFRRRSVWLVVDHVVYPLNSEAAGAVERLFESPPSDVLQRAGLNHTYRRGETMLDQVGIEEIGMIKSPDSQNPFPQCR